MSCFWIGIAAQTIQLSRRRVQLNRLTAMGAALVTESVPRGPAARAGIRAGDIILALDEHKDVTELMQILTYTDAPGAAR